MRKTKIVCTLGPATDVPEVLEALIAGGMNVARLNFSHGSHEEHGKRVEMVKNMREKLGKPVALLLDTKGPEIRFGKFIDGKALLAKNDIFTLSTVECEGTAHEAYINCPTLPQKVGAGNRILLDDGLLELEVVSVSETAISCRVLVGGPISNNKSLNVPGVKLGLRYLSDRDIADIRYGVENGFDYIAASFVRCADDVFDVLRIVEEAGGHGIHIISKIENSEGVENIDEIIKVSDGIMIARGDMGVEINYEELPRIQKMIIKRTVSEGKKSITATQMLESMTNNPRPTRAEISDVANAIYDGTSAIMLSGETSIGKYPVEALAAMRRIAESTESAIHYKKRFSQVEFGGLANVTDAISYATCSTAHSLGAKAIVTVTKSGTTARYISKYRPETPIIGCTTDQRVFRQLSLSWGVCPVLTEDMAGTDDLFDHAIEQSLSTGLISLGDMVVLTAGVPLGVSGTTNLIKVHTVGHVLVRGIGVTRNSAVGQVCVCKNEEDALSNFNEGDILVIPETTNELMRILKKTSGIITDIGGASSHAATVGLLLDIPVICNTQNATSILRSGSTVTIDAARGLVYSGITKV